MGDEMFHAANERQRFKMARGLRFEDVISYSKAGSTYNERCGSLHPTSITSFQGFVPFYEHPAQAVTNSNSSKLRWAEQLLKGIVTDDEELCAVAMMQDHSDAKITVKQQGSGAPYSFHSAGFYTHEQMDTNTKYLKEHIEDRVQSAQLFVSANEWKEIHSWIGSVGRYGEAKLKSVVRGDSALMIAVRLSSFKAAKYMLKIGVDPAMQNENNDSIAEVIEQKYQEIVEERNHIRFLRVQARSVRQMSLSHDDKMALLSEPQVYDKMEQCYNLCVDLSSRFEVRLYNMMALKVKAKMLEVEDLFLSESEQKELQHRETILEGKEIVDKVILLSKDVVEEWEGTKLGAERLKKQKLLEEKTQKEKKLNHWRRIFLVSATKIQSVVRGVICRDRMELLRLHRGCVFVQSHVRGFLDRRTMRKKWLLEAVLLISKLGRGFNGRKKAAKKQNRQYPSQEHKIRMQKSTIGIVDGDGDEDEDENDQVHDQDQDETTEQHAGFNQLEACTAMLNELSEAKVITASAPKGQWATLRFMNLRLKLEESKKEVLNDRNNSEKLAKLAGLCLEHGTSDSPWIPEDQKLEFLDYSASLFERAISMKDYEGTGLVEKRRGESMLKCFLSKGVLNEHIYLINAVAAFTRGLTNIEIVISPEVWLDLAIANEYLGDIEASMKTYAAMVRKFPNFTKMNIVAMRSSYLHMKLGIFDKACSYLSEAKKGEMGGTCGLYSKMNMIMIGGRFNEMWYEKGNVRTAIAEEEEGGDADEEDDVRESKREIAEKAYKVVFHWFLQHNNTGGKRNCADWVGLPGTWLRIAIRASKSGNYMLAEELYRHALDKSLWDYDNKVRGFNVEEWLEGEDCVGVGVVVGMCCELAKCCYYRWNGTNNEEEMNDGKLTGLEWLDKAVDCERRGGESGKCGQLKIMRAHFTKKAANKLASDCKVALPKLIFGMPGL